jgi:hypothetical protein
MNTFWGIWTWPYGKRGGGMTVLERLRRTNELFWRALAHRLPRKLAFWSFIDSGVRYMKSDEVVPDVTYTVLLQRVGEDANLT